MIFDIENMDIADFRKSLQDLQKELSQELQTNAESTEEVIPLLTSISRLLKELPAMKSPADAKSKEFLQCVPDLAFVMQCLNPGEDFDDNEDFDDEEEFEGEDFELIDNADDEDSKPKKKK